MRRSVEKQLDALLCLALEEHAKKTAASIAAMATSSVVRPDWIDEKVRKTIESHTPKFGAVRRKSPARVLAIAAIITAMIVLTLSVSGFGETIWRSIVSWYDDYVSVSFVPSPSEDAVGTQAPPTVEVPNVILEHRKPQGLPEGYYEVEALDSGLCFISDFFCEEEWKFNFQQSILSGGDVWIDNSDSTVKQIEINGYPGSLHHSEDGMAVVVWTDGEYLYIICADMSEIELIPLAESVK